MRRVRRRRALIQHEHAAAAPGARARTSRRARPSGARSAGSRTPSRHTGLRAPRRVVRERKFFTNRGGTPCSRTQFLARRRARALRCRAFAFYGHIRRRARVLRPRRAKFDFRSSRGAASMAWRTTRFQHALYTGSASWPSGARSAGFRRRASRGRSRVIADVRGAARTLDRGPRPRRRALFLLRRLPSRVACVGRHLHLGAAPPADGFPHRRAGTPSSRRAAPRIGAAPN